MWSHIIVPTYLKFKHAHTHLIFSSRFKSHMWVTCNYFLWKTPKSLSPLVFRNVLFQFGLSKEQARPRNHITLSSLRVLCWSLGPPWTWTSVLTPSISTSLPVLRTEHPIFLCSVAQPEQRRISRSSLRALSTYLKQTSLLPIIIRTKGINALHECLLCQVLYEHYT